MKSLINTGDMFDVRKPLRSQITLESIAGALSHVCRFNGHCGRFYCVAEHSLLVSHILEAQGYDKGVQLAGLLHDAAEAYVGDIVTPIKRDKQIASVFDPIEREVLHTIAAALGCNDLLGGEPSVIVQAADEIALQIERANLLPPNKEWPVLGRWDVDEPAVIVNRYLNPTKSLVDALTAIQYGVELPPSNYSNDFINRYEGLTK